MSGPWTMERVVPRVPGGPWSLHTAHPVGQSVDEATELSTTGSSAFIAISSEHECKEGLQNQGRIADEVETSGGSSINSMLGTLARPEIHPQHPHVPGKFMRNDEKGGTDREWDSVNPRLMADSSRSGPPRRGDAPRSEPSGERQGQSAGSPSRQINLKTEKKLNNFKNWEKQ
ncbi:hypothetical protein B0H13DRAFT_1882100 [Mycena leptocephala]|nr:hypothetical protein B0H13DRAFT_1882100 [Mycena leptocephala]